MERARPEPRQDDYRARERGLAVTLGPTWVAPRGAAFRGKNHPATGSGGARRRGNAIRSGPMSRDECAAEGGGQSLTYSSNITTWRYLRGAAPYVQYRT